MLPKWWLLETEHLLHTDFFIKRIWSLKKETKIAALFLLYISYAFLIMYIAT